jgi:pilus assembly protein Flp/PilA
MWEAPEIRKLGPDAAGTGPAHLTRRTDRGHHVIDMIRTFIDHYHPREDGATAVEYGIMVAAIAVAIITIVFILGGQLEGLFERVSDEIGSQ